ncbi:MAG: DUF2628 domain-containing protein [Hyphomicrobiaceae bacterium]|nr:DUF2628 domain-containing protein [Hyphomicrobiaceae bacterium]
MQAYTVHEAPNRPANRLKRAERLVFVREGFSWMAALFAPLWMLWHRMWLVLLLYVVAVAALDAALLEAGVSTQWVALGTLAVHLALGFEAGALRRWKLDRRGWRTLGVVTGHSESDCERRFFQAWLGEKVEERDDGSVRLSAGSRSAPEEPVRGAGGLEPASPAGSRA